MKTDLKWGKTDRKDSRGPLLKSRHKIEMPVMVVRMESQEAKVMEKSGIGIDWLGR